MYNVNFEKLETLNKDELLKLIRKTKRKITFLKRKMENPNYCQKLITCPTDLTIYKCERDFLEMVIARYLLLGGKLKNSKQT